jgi:hypothetical protein
LLRPEERVEFEWIPLNVTAATETHLRQERLLQATDDHHDVKVAK